MVDRLNVLDLFCGKRGWSQKFIERDHYTFGIDNEEKFSPDLCADISRLTPANLRIRGGWDVILASPPCTKFTVMTIGRNWNKDHTPKTPEAKEALDLVLHTLYLIDELQPRMWTMENPRAKLRRLLEIHRPELVRRTVSYCQYGEERQKPTDLWSDYFTAMAVPLRDSCDSGANSTRRGHDVSIGGVLWRTDASGVPCHRSAKRGTTHATQGMDSADSAKVPYKLSEVFCLGAEAALA